MEQPPLPSLGHVLMVKLRAKPGQDSALVRAMLDYVPYSLKEPGTRQFQFYRNASDPLSFMLYEDFVDEAALATHRADPRHDQTLATIAPMLESTHDRTVWTQVAVFFGETAKASPPPVPDHVTLPMMRLKPEGVMTFIDEVRQNVARSRGTIRFDLNRDPNDLAHFMLCARWVDRAAWDAQQKDPAFQGFRERTAPCFESGSPPTLWVRAQA